MRPTYRPDIDGLRAIAVSAVVVYHAFPSGFEGGYAGVDVFFVISGYLITLAILGSSKEEKFSFGKFYARRIRRLFPALSLVFASSLIAGWFVLDPREFSQLGKHILSGSGFTSNLVLWKESGYFDTTADLKPLLHLWSLGVEEQFYIFFPAVTYLMLRFRLPRFSILASITVTSLITSVIVTNFSPTAAFYNPATRVWEILIGALIADISLRGSITSFKTWYTHCMSVVGLSLIVLAIVLFDSRTQFPGYAALLPTLGSGLVILSGPSSLLNKFLLSNKVVVLIGLISYPIYLWHWPILVFLRIQNGIMPSVIIRWFAVFVAILLAYLTYRFVEQPLRFRISPNKSVVALVTGMIFLAGVGGSVYALDGFPSRLGKTEKLLAAFSPNIGTDSRSGTCWVDQFVAANSFAEECTGAFDRAEQVVLWGDSHAARFYPGLVSAVSSDVSISQFTRSSCPGILHVEFQECRDSNEEVLRRISSISPQTVMLFGRWDTYLSRETAESFRINLTSTIQSLNKVGVKNILLMGPAPFWSGSLPSNLIDLLRETKSTRLPKFTKFRLTEIAQDTENLLRPIAENIVGVTYFSVFDTLCPAGDCLVTVDGQVDGLTTWDYGHLTTPAARFVAERVVRKILELSR